MNVLIINAGSSSLKYQLMDPETGAVSAKGLCERIYIDGRLTHNANGKKIVKDIPMPTHSEAIQAVLAILVDPVDGVIKSTDEIDAVGHRVLHGGMEFFDSCIINDEVIAAIEKCIPLGPLHNPANLMGIRACQAVMPNTPQVAVFDTAFHMTMPPKAYRYAIPTEYYENDSIRRYGFHGTSHKYVTKRAIELMGRKDIKLVKRGRIKEYAAQVPGSTYTEGFRGIWTIPCDIALPCATQNEITAAEAEEIVKGGAMAVAEGANMPTTLDATEYLMENGIVFMPGKASNAGGVATSGLEMSQNSERLSWTFEEVDAKLKGIMEGIFHASYDASVAAGSEGNLMVGANCAGFLKVATAMMAQGITY